MSRGRRVAGSGQARIEVERGYGVERQGSAAAGGQQRGRGGTEGRTEGRLGWAEQRGAAAAGSKEGWLGQRRGPKGCGGRRRKGVKAAAAREI